MKRIFFALFIILFLSSCEDDINSPNNNENNSLGCSDPTACNFNPIANINDGTCIYASFDSQECIDFDTCQLNSDNIWLNHTCLDSDSQPFLNWDGRESSCGYFYQNGGFSYSTAVNNGTPCPNLSEQGCSTNVACFWDADNQICDLRNVCEDVDGNSLEGWDVESNTAVDDCNNAFICEDSNGNSYINWDSQSNTAEDDCNNVYSYIPGSCDTND